MLVDRIDFNEEILYNQIADMYRRRSTEPIASFCTALQLEAFQKEIDVLNKYNLYKDLQFDLKRNDDQSPSTAINQKYDGKVMTNFIVTGGKTKETYRNDRQRKKYQRKIKNAFLTANVLKSNLLVAYSATGEVHCNNCGAPMEHLGDQFHCAYCGSTYATEAVRYLLSRFQIDDAMKGVSKIWYVLGPMIVLVLLQQFGIINPNLFMKLQFYFSIVVAVILTVLFFGALGYGIYQQLKNYLVRSKLQAKDPNFSKELLQQRIIDILQLDPQILQEHGKFKGNILCRNIPMLIFKKYHLDDQNEEIELVCKVNGLYIQGSPDRPKLKDKQKKYRIVLYRRANVITKVHYEPDQYTCNNCGSHEVIKSSDEQICSYCGTRQAMDAIDWVLVGIK
ncbi:MAG TPA: hypothetical protein GX708_03960 [Gallicola sp.]|nr:hypothetical protein [Gallicola sp.]